MRSRIGLIVLAAFAASCSVALASAISPSQVTQIVSFGDSLSDAGNASIATFGAAPGPLFVARYRRVISRSDIC